MDPTRSETDLQHLGVILLSDTYQVIGMNDFAARVLGMDPGQLGRPVHRYHPPRSHEKIGALLGQARDTNSGLPVAMIIDVLGKVLMISVSRLQMAPGQQRGFLVANFVDVTEKTGAQVNPHSGLVQLEKFPVYHKEGLIFLDTEAIYFCRAEGNYCTVQTRRRAYFIHDTLKNLQERYARASFFRVHKSFVANLKHAKAIGRSPAGRPQLVFDLPHIPPVPIARRRLGGLKKALGLG